MSEWLLMLPEWFQSYWILAAVAACILAVAVAMSLRRQIRMENSEKRISNLEVGLGRLTATPSLAFRQELIAELTHNHTPEMDDLLARIDNLTLDEYVKLEILIQERIINFVDPMITDSERDAARMVLMVNKRVQIKTAVAGY